LQRWGSKEYKLDSQTLKFLAEMICGDGGPVYRTGSELTRFFHRVGFSNFNHDGSTRKWWALSVLEQLSENNLKAVICRLADPREYRGNSDLIRPAIEELNDILMLEGIKGSAKNKLLEFAPKFAVDLIDLIEQNRRNSELFRGLLRLKIN
jgi:hypothetical protein